MHDGGDMPYKWMPKPLDRILKPFYENCDVETKASIDEALRAIAADPYNPPIPTRPYKGSDLPNARIAIVDDHIYICYQIFRDYPLLGLRNVVDVQTATDTEER